MKKILMVAITLLALSGCLGITKQEQANFKEYEKLNQLKEIKVIDSKNGVKIYEIDSCEYIGSMDYKHELLTHKGNCKFCKQRNSK